MWIKKMCRLQAGALIISTIITSCRHISNFTNYNCIEQEMGDRGSTVVKVLCYKSKDRWFDPSWC